MRIKGGILYFEFFNTKGQLWRGFLERKRISGTKCFKIVFVSKFEEYASRNWEFIVKIWSTRDRKDINTYTCNVDLKSDICFEIKEFSTKVRTYLAHVKFSILYFANPWSEQYPIRWCTFLQYLMYRSIQCEVHPIQILRFLNFLNCTWDLIIQLNLSGIPILIIFGMNLFKIHLF